MLIDRPAENKLFLSHRRCTSYNTRVENSLSKTFCRSAFCADLLNTFWAALTQDYHENADL
jgi:hypothetical protein